MERSRLLKGVANLPRVVSELSYMRSLTHAAVARGPIWLCAFGPVLSEISDLCEISDLLLFVSYFASQSKGIQLGDYFLDVCCVN